MSMPGFTAEASLYKTKKRWQSASTRCYASGANEIISQLSFNPFPISTEPVYLVACFADFVVRRPIPTVWTLAKAPSTIRSHPLTA